MGLSQLVVEVHTLNHTLVEEVHTQEEDEDGHMLPEDAQEHLAWVPHLHLAPHETSSCLEMNYLKKTVDGMVVEPDGAVDAGQYLNAQAHVLHSMPAWDLAQAWENDTVPNVQVLLPDLLH